MEGQEFGEAGKQRSRSCVSFRVLAQHSRMASSDSDSSRERRRRRRSDSEERRRKKKSKRKTRKRSRSRDKRSRSRFRNEQKSSCLARRIEHVNILNNPPGLDIVARNQGQSGPDPMRGRTAGGQGPTQGIGDLAQERGGGQKTGGAGDESDMFSGKEGVNQPSETALRILFTIYQYAIIVSFSKYR